jgi:hypothetical protein
MRLPTVLLRLSCVLSVASALTSCSIGFHSDWRKAAKADATLQPKNLGGAWEGTWKSIASGHNGKLKAVATSVPTKDGASEKYVFRYHATWGKVLSGTFQAEHTAKPATDSKGRKEGKVLLSGEKDLGTLGGVYSFTGTATPSTFHADYKSSMDHGVFELKRPVK